MCVPVLAVSPQSRDLRVSLMAVVSPETCPCVCCCWQCPLRAVSVPQPACASSAVRVPTARCHLVPAGSCLSTSHRPHRVPVAQPVAQPVVRPVVRLSQAARGAGGKRPVNAALLRGVGVTDNYLN